jgi:hypothetical protein
MAGALVLLAADRQWLQTDNGCRQTMAADRQWLQTDNGCRQTMAVCYAADRQWLQADNGRGDKMRVLARAQIPHITHIGWASNPPTILLKGRADTLTLTLTLTPTILLKGRADSGSRD